MHGDVADMRDGDRAMAGFGGGIAGLARFHAINEVAMLASLAASPRQRFAGPIQVHFVRADHRVEDLRVARHQRGPPIVETDPAFAALEADTRVRAETFIVTPLAYL